MQTHLILQALVLVEEEAGAEAVGLNFSYLGKGVLVCDNATKCNVSLFAIFWFAIRINHQMGWLNMMVFQMVFCKQG